MPGKSGTGVRAGRSLPDTLVTGASGFIGGHVTRHLRQDPSARVFAGTRAGRGEGARRLDLLDPATLPPALEGIDSIVHCAVGGRAVTVEGTRALLDAAARAGVRRVVHLSSVSVYGGAGGRVTESAPTVAPDGGGYAAWKAAAEEVCREPRGLAVTILRPAIVYGPGSELWAGKMADRLRAGHWGTFGPGGEGTCNLVHVRDVAGAVAAALAAPSAGGAFNVNGPEAMPWNEWFRRLSAGLGAPPLAEIPPAEARRRALFSLPFKALGRISPALMPGWARAAPARSELALFALTATYPADAAASALGWSPTIGVEEGLRDTLEWLAARPVPLS